MNVGEGRISGESREVDIVKGPVELKLIALAIGSSRVEFGGPALLLGTVKGVVVFLGRRVVIGAMGRLVLSGGGMLVVGAAVE